MSAPQLQRVVDRRAHRRGPQQTQVTLLLPEGESCKGSDQIQVWTQDVSLSGFSFVCPAELKATTLKVESEEFEGTVDIEIVRSREVADGVWEYGAALKRFGALPSVHRKAQKAIMNRIVKYWCYCLLFITVPLIIAKTLTEPDMIVFDRLLSLWSEHSPVFVTLLMLIPVTLYDTWRLTSRLADAAATKA
jgi:hypothetical protein